jgi:hypothetical protein
VDVSHIRRSVVLLLAISMVSLQMLRTEHVHPAGIEGRTESLVHSHSLVGKWGDTRARAAHGDHRLAIFLTPIYESAAAHPSQSPPSATLTPGAIADDPLLGAAALMPAESDSSPPGIATHTHHGRSPPIH